MRRLKDITKEEAKQVAKDNGLRYVHRERVIKNSTGSFVLNLHDETAYSYKWWKFFKFDKDLDKYVRNSYNYSNSTAKHQHKLCSILRSLGITYVELSTSESLTGIPTKDLVTKEADLLYKEAKDYLEAKGKHKRTKGDLVGVMLGRLLPTHSRAINVYQIKAIMDVCAFIGLEEKKAKFNLLAEANREYLKHSKEYMSLVKTIKEEKLTEEVETWLK